MPRSVVMEPEAEHADQRKHAPTGAAESHESTLADLVRERGLEARLAASIVRDLARQVAVLHRHGVSHGQISARTVLVNHDATVDISLPTDPPHDDPAAAFGADLHDLGALLAHIAGGGEDPAYERGPIATTDVLPASLSRIAERALHGCGANGYRSAARLASALERYLVMSEWGLIES